MQMSIPFKPVVDNNVLCFTPIFQNQTDIMGCFFLISSNIFVKSYFTKKSILFILAGKKSLLTLVNK